MKMPQKVRHYLGHIHKGYDFFCSFNIQKSNYKNSFNSDFKNAKAIFVADSPSNKSFKIVSRNLSELDTSGFKAVFLMF